MLHIGYVEDLMSALMKIVTAGKVTDAAIIPDFLCSEFERPDKKNAIQEKQTRFSK